jgi:hypothetical protein
VSDATGPTRRCHQRTGGALGLLAAAVLAVVLAACGTSSPAAPSSHQSPRALSSPAPHASAPTPAVTSKHAVENAYLAFWAISDRAEKTGNAAAAQAVLAPYVNPDYISDMISGMQAAWGKDEIGWGNGVDHIQKIIVAALNSGAYVAQVQDCQDDSHSGLASAKTGDLIPGTLGSPHQELYSSLSLVKGHWLIDQVTYVNDTCTR